MRIYARQGDVVIRRAEATGDLVPAVDLVVAGAHSHPHTVAGACLYRVAGRATHVRVLTATSLTHAGRHLPVPLPPGDYRMSPLRERGDESDRAVED